MELKREFLELAFHSLPHFRQEQEGKQAEVSHVVTSLS